LLKIFLLSGPDIKSKANLDSGLNSVRLVVASSSLIESFLHGIKKCILSINKTIEEVER